VIPPCIDVLSPKNRDLAPQASQAVLESSVVELPIDAPFVLQVSRWDPLKDHEGVLRAFVELCRAGGTDAHLVLAGPDTDGVDDDPEGAATLEHVQELWAAQSAPLRERIHLASIPMDDTEENALVVNALQRRAQVVVQKSLAEGFGLTVAEAMWKERPVVGSRVGGIQDQIVHGESGLLVDDPTDTVELARDLATLLQQPEYRDRLGVAARRRVSEHFLPLHQFEREAALLERLLASTARSSMPRSSMAG
jgi:trehalose synthase